MYVDLIPFVNLITHKPQAQQHPEYRCYSHCAVVKQSGCQVSAYCHKYAGSCYRYKAFVDVFKIQLEALNNIEAPQYKNS